MRGDPQVIEALNEILTAELTAINQYMVHSRMCENWGYLKQAQAKRKLALDEMHDAQDLIDRILYLDGVPNLQRLFPVRVGEDVPEQHKLDLAVEAEAIARLNKAIALCVEKGDNGSRELAERILKGEETHYDMLEAELHQIEELGKAPYLAQQIRGQ
jgi:bacterioferritin